jgi:hypothetical protein
MKRYLVTAMFLFGIFLACVSPARASEGTIELRSMTKDSYRCYATSVLMQDFNYLVSVTCRDLIYPANDSILYYVLWGTPVGGGNPIRFTELGLGRVSFKTKSQFTKLFVTIETNPKARTPSSDVVMRGDLETIRFLERPISTTPTTAPVIDQNNITVTPTITEESTEALSTKDKLFIAMRRAGIVAGVVLVVLVGVVFAVTKSKG